MAGRSGRERAAAEGGGGAAFDPERCDLCGSPDHAVLVALDRPRAMRSDREVVARPLRKRACRRCGLVRSGDAAPPGSLASYYGETYGLAGRGEHCFYTEAGPVSRSAAFADWLVSLAPDAWRGGRRCLEVGAGAGHLLRELAGRFPAAAFEGLEPGRDAVRLARAGGLAVREGSLPAAPRPEYDLVYAVAVVEHVASPTEFLRRIRGVLRPGGWLLLSQPVQDVPSYDVLFVDHLHHFGSAHLRAYARKCGFDEAAAAVGHPLMPNFSAHAWRASGRGDGFAWRGAPAPLAAAAAARGVLADLARLDARLESLRAAGRRVAVFGLGEVYWLARAYSSLEEFPVVCGFDDMPDRAEYARLGFPVVRPEAGPGLGVQDVILAMNRLYYPMAMTRLRRLGLVAHPVLS
jgi:2-polyprenyl-3-methyl-5-hydroxy-6-metoxy-1,4-benzoquinol methylase